MIKRNLTVLLILVFGYQSVMAQECVSYEVNGIRAKDSILIKQLVNYFDAGDAGVDVTWNFPDVVPIASCQISQFSDSDSLYLYEVTPSCINKYENRTDSLLLLSYEMPLQKIVFDKPVALLAYPFSYNDEYESTYIGTGTYCQTQSIDKCGYIDVAADGLGTLILGTDTLQHSTRIHSISTGSICMYDDSDSTELLDNWMKQEIVERYLWFVKGYRYPVLETITISYYNDMEQVSCIQNAYCYSPDMQCLLSDEDNTTIRVIDSLADVHTSEPDIIHYSVSTIGSQIRLSYSLSTDARISLLVCNRMGMMYRRESFTMQAGQEYIKNIDCSGMPPDAYILYLNVNGIVYSEKIKL